MWLTLQVGSFLVLSESEKYFSCVLQRELHAGVPDSPQQEEARVLRKHERPNRFGVLELRELWFSASHLCPAAPRGELVVFVAHPSYSQNKHLSRVGNACPQFLPPIRLKWSILPSSCFCFSKLPFWCKISRKDSAFSFHEGREPSSSHTSTFHLSAGSWRQGCTGSNGPSFCSLWFLPQISCLFFQLISHRSFFQRKPRVSHLSGIFLTFHLCRF